MPVELFPGGAEVENLHFVPRLLAKTDRLVADEQASSFCIDLTIFNELDWHLRSPSKQRSKLAEVSEAGSMMTSRSCSTGSR